MIEKMNITNVHERKVTERRLDIYFTIENREYQLIVIKHLPSNKFEADSIYHNDDDDEGACSFCRNEKAYCSTLNTYRDFIFKRLIEHPSIRLKWLYLPH